MALHRVQYLADLLDVGRDWVYTQVELEAIPHHRLPSEGSGKGLIRFSDEDIAQILAATEKAPVSPMAGLLTARRVA